MARRWEQTDGDDRVEERIATDEATPPLFKRLYNHSPITRLRQSLSPPLAPRLCFFFLPPQPSLAKAVDSYVFPAAQRACTTSRVVVGLRTALAVRSGHNAGLLHAPHIPGIIATEGRAWRKGRKRISRHRQVSPSTSGKLLWPQPWRRPPTRWPRVIRGRSSVHTRAASSLGALFLGHAF